MKFHALFVLPKFRIKNIKKNPQFKYFAIFPFVRHLSRVCFISISTVDSLCKG